MNFYVDSGGAILGVDPEKIYQGSANANTIRFVGAFASNVKVTVAFKLPTGVWTTPQLMTASTQLAGVVTSNGVQFNVWEYAARHAAVSDRRYRAHLKPHRNFAQL